MKFTGEFELPAGREAVFDKINDPVFFASCIEGVSDLEEIDPTHYRAQMETRIAYIKFRFDIEIEVVEATRPERLVARAVGAPRGIVGRLTSQATARLVEAGDATRLVYEIDLALAGKLGSIGQPVLRSKAREMETAFVRNIGAAFENMEEVTS